MGYRTPLHDNTGPDPKRRKCCPDSCQHGQSNDGAECECRPWWLQARAQTTTLLARRNAAKRIRRVALAAAQADGSCHRLLPTPTPASFWTEYPRPDSLPLLAAYGESQCGRHAAACAGMPAVAVLCKLCLEEIDAAHAHMLPCGHALCRPCLDDSVLVAKKRLQTAKVQAKVRFHMVQHFFGKREPEPAPAQTRSQWPQPQGPPMDLPSTASPLNVLGAANSVNSANNTAPTRTSRHHRLALAAAGLTCCDQSMELDKHFSCMGPEEALVYMHIHEGLRWPPNDRMCGWPDCRFFLLSELAFERDGMWVSYCAACRGRSLYSSTGTTPAW